MVCPRGFGSKLGGGELLADSVAHGIVGGVSSELSGGSFKSGFVGSSVAFAASGAYGKGTKLGNAIGRQGRIFAAALSGGTASRLAGGKFANGAVTAAAGQAFNGEGHASLFGRMKSIGTGLIDYVRSHTSVGVIRQEGLGKVIAVSTDMTLDFEKASTEMTLGHGVGKETGFQIGASVGPVYDGMVSRYEGCLRSICAAVTVSGHPPSNGANGGIGVSGQISFVPRANRLFSTAGVHKTIYGKPD